MNTFVVLMMVGFAAAATTVEHPAINVYEVLPASGKSPVGIAGIQNAPIYALEKTSGKYTAYLLQHGLTTIANNPAPAIRHLKELVAAKNAESALIISPTTLSEGPSPILEQIRAAPIAQLELPENINIEALAKIAGGQVPIVVLLGNEELTSRNYPEVQKYGAVDLATLTAPTPYPYRAHANNPAAKSQVPEVAAAPKTPAGYNPAAVNPAPGPVPVPQI
ncbi:hypothetical protein C0J52_25538 [Blattella germanica]|nr:hypothetical protein C0J52_25538 [Blattella germanica]